MVADRYLEVAHGVVISIRYPAVMEMVVEVVLVVVEVVVIMDVVEDESFHPLPTPKSAHKKGLGHAPVLIFSTVSTRKKGTGIGQADGWGCYMMMW